MKRRLALAVCTLAMLLVRPAPAAADLTAFLGFSPTPEMRPVRGFSLGVNLLVVGFEFEYANTSEDETGLAPGLRTGMANALVMTPTTTQLYATAGGGFFRERTGEVSETSFGTNIGGGVKIGLAGPIRLRLDYRVFALRGNPRFKNPQRFYAGLNIAF